MSELTNKASYLKGLADGMKLDTEKNEGKLLAEIIDFLSMISEKMELLMTNRALLQISLMKWKRLLILSVKVYMAMMTVTATVTKIFA